MAAPSGDIAALPQTAENGPGQSISEQFSQAIDNAMKDREKSSLETDRDRKAKEATLVWNDLNNNKMVDSGEVTMI